MLNLRSRQRGVSMIEVMVVIVIMAILMAIGIPSLQSWLAKSRVRLKTEAVLNGMQLARGEALRRNARVFYTLNADSSWTVGCVTLVGDLNNDGVTDCPLVIQSKPAGEGGEGVVLATSPAGATTATFTGIGLTAANADASARITQVDFSAAGTTQTFRVVLSSGGQSRLCDPAVTATGDPRLC
jgi:type IV fimbrial biogenesis protein FimT